MALPRVVLVGFNKCGTRSFARVFAEAGHAALHNKLRSRWRRSRNAARMMRDNLANGGPVFAGMDSCTLYSDLVHVTDDGYFERNETFREILRDYPDTILLLNLRDREDWIRSRLKHRHRMFALLSLKALQLPDQAALIRYWRDLWDRHLADVRGFMADKPGQLVEFNIDTDDISDFCQTLPTYGLDPASWADTGRTSGVKRHPLRAWLALRWAHLRPKRNN